MKISHALHLGLCAILLVLLTGCAQFGPKAIQVSRTDYNIAMSRTDEEQALLNLVRLRYDDRAYFLEATALNTQFSITSSGALNSTLNSGSDDAYSLGGSLAYEESPTISYAPLTGEAFVRRVLSRIPLETILLLDSSGWSTDRVLRMCVERLNNLENAPKASGPTPSVGSDVSAFRRAISLLTLFQDEQQLMFLRKSPNTESPFIAKFTPAGMARPEFRELTNLLDLDPSTGEYTFTENSLRMDRQTIFCSARSFMGVLYFLSQAVEVPEKDISAGVVAVTKTPSGETFDLDSITNGLLSIQSGPSKPRTANISVNYRNSCFYIDDTDITSKSTFALLRQLFALQSKNSDAGVPVLTLPIGN